MSAIANTFVPLTIDGGNDVPKAFAISIPQET
jgi:hypothetical protein